jgi:hypothetical protein
MIGSDRKPAPRSHQESGSIWSIYEQITGTFLCDEAVPMVDQQFDYGGTNQNKSIVTRNRSADYSLLLHVYA